MRDALQVLGEPRGLLRGALAIASHARPGLDVAEVEGQLDALADAVLCRASHRDDRTLHAYAHVVLFDEEGFRGASSDDYSNPKNSFLDSVLARRRGLPIVLALVYVQVLQRLGIRAEGLDAPAHFLARVYIDRAPGSEDAMIVDVFERGRPLRVDEARDRLARLIGVRPTAERVLRPASHRQWLLRMLRNLTSSYGTGRRMRDVAAMGELQALVERA